MLGKVNRHTKFTVKHSLGCNACSPPIDIVAQPSCADANAQCLVKAHPNHFHAITAYCKYLNLKLLHSYSFKDGTYHLTKILFIYVGLV